MALLVEDGTGLPEAASYVSVAEFRTYISDQGYTIPQVESDEPIESALRRATSWLDASYRDQFPGYQSRGREQRREWPRIGAYVEVPDNGRSRIYDTPGTYAGYGYQLGLYYIQPNEIPREIRAATCEAAYRELAKPGSLAPDLKRGGMIQSVGAGSARVEYFPGAPATTQFQSIDLVLGSLLIAVNPYSGKVVRG